MGYHSVYNDECLMHHGVKGMKWGVRRYRNPDGSLTDLGRKHYGVNGQIRMQKDGSVIFQRKFTFNRVGGSTLDFNASGALYVSHGKVDVHRYIKSLGPTVIGKILGQAHTSVQKISAKGDIRMPSDKVAIEETLKCLQNSKNLRQEFDKSIYSMLIEDGNYNKNPELTAYAVSSMLGDENYKDAAHIVYNYFRSKNFDAIPDLHDKMSGTSENPVIIINKDKVEMTSSTVITKDMMKTGKKIVKQYGKLPVHDALK